MSIEYRDGSFSENEPVEFATKKFFKELQLDDRGIKALHIGSEDELNRIKKKKKLEAEIESLKERIEVLEEQKITSEVIVIPTKVQIDNIKELLEKKEITDYRRT